MLCVPPHTLKELSLPGSGKDTLMVGLEKVAAFFADPLL